MSDQVEIEPVQIDQETIENQAAAVDAIENTLDSFLAAASVEAVYGEPIKQRDMTIIPAAEVVSAMGFGLGYGAGGSDEEGGGQGGGGGGGGRVFSRPVAVIIATPDGVRVEPVFDLTKVVMAGLTAGAFVLGALVRMRRAEADLARLQRKLRAG
jgi:uncharacterized spore protein YtfJ